MANKYKRFSKANARGGQGAGTFCIRKKQYTEETISAAIYKAKSEGMDLTYYICPQCQFLHICKKENKWKDERIRSPKKCRRN